jgi:O-antigen/teichoic acid export membrane protein
MTEAASRTSLMRRTVWSATATVIATASRLVVGIIIARTLEPAGMGRVVYFVWVADFTQTIASLGLTNSIIRYTAQLGGANQHAKATGLVRWLTTRYMIAVFVAFCVLLWLGVRSTYQSSPTVDEYWLLAALLFALQSGSALFRAYLTGRQWFAQLAQLNLSSSAILLIGTGIGASSYGQRGALLAYVAAELVGVIWLVTLLRGREPSVTPDRALRRRVLEYASFSWLAALVSAILWSRVEVYFLNRYLGPAEVATFTTAVTISALVSQSALLVTGALVPHFSELSGASDRSTLELSYARITRLTALILLPLSFGTAALSPRLVPLLFGPRFEMAVVPSAILAIAAALLVSAPSTALLYALEKTKALAMMSAIAALFAITSFAMIIPRYGATGAAWARFGTQTLVVCAVFLFIARVLRIAPPLSAIARSALAAMVSSVIAFLTSRAISGPAGLPTALLVATGAYVVSLRFVRGVDESDIATIERLIERLPIAARERTHRVLLWVARSRGITQFEIEAGS